MFTGIVESIGRVSQIDVDGTTGGWVLSVSDAQTVLDDVHLGDSIAVNGKRLSSVGRSRQVLTALSRHLFDCHSL
jgi:riboflavin synthase